MDRNYPDHVAIILDGNRRWAKRQGLPPLQGHKKGFQNTQELVPYIIDKGVKVLSVFAFSNENFSRSKEEVTYLMDMFVNWFKKEFNKLHKENIKIIFSGRREPLREDVLEAMDYIKEKTKNNTKGVFNICINYGGQQEIVDATKKIAKDVKLGKLNEEAIDEKTLYHYMYNDLPPVDLLIRTSGEQRLSNFLLYELSYAEFLFTPICFPDFNREHFEEAIDEFNKRERKFGGDANETKNN